MCEARMRISAVRVVNYIVFKIIQFASNQDGAKITTVCLVIKYCYRSKPPSCLYSGGCTDNDCSFGRDSCDCDSS